MMIFIKENLLDDFFPNFIHVEFEHELESGDLGHKMEGQIKSIYENLI